MSTDTSVDSVFTQKVRSQMLVFHLLVASLSRKNLDIRKLLWPTDMDNFYYSYAERENKRKNLSISISMVEEREKEKVLK